MMKRILLVEDEENFGSLLQNYLRLSNYSVDWVKDGSLGYSAFMKSNYDLCILDVMMPNMDGFSLAEKIKLKKKEIPIIFLTAKTMKEDMIRGYRIGADDYLNKPFDIEVLLLKLEVIFNRSMQKEKSQVVENYSIGNFSYTVKTRLLTSKNDEKRLSPKEGALLHLLYQYLGDVLPREKALIEIWGEDNYFTTRSMDVYITKLRKYLKSDPRIQIDNVHSSGYRLFIE